MKEFDLQKIKEAQADDGWLDILHPQTGEKTPIRIHLAGPDSEVFRKADRRIKNRNLASLQKRGNQTRLTTEQIEANSIELLKAITLGWDGVTWGGAPLEFSPENVETLYTEFSFIREQVDEFVGDRQNFFSN